MSTVWDRAVRALQTVMPSLDGEGRPLAYYCGGPKPACAHPTCRAVSALAEADLLHDGAIFGAGDATLVRDPDDAQRVSDELLRLVCHFESVGAGERAYGANYARMVVNGYVSVEAAPTGKGTAR